MSEYDASEWKRGDLAEVTARWKFDKPHFEMRARRGYDAWLTISANQSAADHMVSAARPLVVIDPEDTEEVGRLVGALTKTSGEFDDIPVTSFGLILSVALRDFAHPTPRIVEPTGLGAVVEDADGRRWVNVPSVGGGRGANWVDQSSLENPWADIDATRILSPGYTPEETP